jgi:superfamily II DNA or RNA helicase
MIEVKQKDAVYLQLNTDPGIKQELNDYFSFEVPGAKFHPLYKSRMWDGRVRLFSMFAGEIYVGLLDYVKKFCEDREYDLDLSALNIPTDAPSRDQVKEYCESLNLGSRGQALEIREYQIDAVWQALAEGRKLLLSPTGSGKSLIIYCLMRWNLDHKRNQLIIVPTTSLVEQLYTDFKDYSCLNDFTVPDHVYRIYAGHEKSNLYPVVISTWQSLYKLPKAFFVPFHCVYGDEAHLFKAKSLSNIMHKCINAHYRFGTTGTLDGTKTHKLVLEGLFSTVYKVTTTKKLMNNQQLADLKIYNIVLEYPDEIRKSCKELTYQEEMDFLVQHNRRNIFIRNLAIKQTGNTLVLFQFVEKHGKLLYDMIWSKCEDRQVFFVYGGTDTEQREKIRQLTETEKDAIIVASYGTFSTGINIKNLHNIIFASPSKSRIRNLQSIGRGLRTSETKDSCNLYDIADDLSWKSHKNFTLLHMIERIKIYNEEQFDYKLIKVQL